MYFFCLLEFGSDFFFFFFFLNSCLDSKNNTRCLNFLLNVLPNKLKSTLEKKIM